MIRPDAGGQALPQLVEALVVAVQPDPGQVDAGPLRHGQLAAGADVEAQPLLADPAGDRGAEERLGGVVDLPARERLGEGAGAGAQVVLVDDVRPASRTARPARSTSTPATVSTPSSSLPTSALHSRGSSALTSSGSASQPGRAGGRVGVDRAGDVGVGHDVERCQTGRAPARPRRGLDGRGGTAAPGHWYISLRPRRGRTPVTDRPAPVAQGIEHRPPEAVAQVRILPGAPTRRAETPASAASGRLPRAARRPAAVHRTGAHPRGPCWTAVDPRRTRPVGDRGRRVPGAPDSSSPSPSPCCSPSPAAAPVPAPSPANPLAGARLWVGPALDGGAAGGRLARPAVGPGRRRRRRRR